MLITKLPPVFKKYWALRATIRACREWVESTASAASAQHNTAGTYSRLLRCLPQPADAAWCTTGLARRIGSQVLDAQASGHASTPEYQRHLHCHASNPLCRQVLCQPAIPRTQTVSTVEQTVSTL
jgi:hypothetical protein